MGKLNFWRCIAKTKADPSGSLALRYVDPLGSPYRICFCFQVYNSLYNFENKTMLITTGSMVRTIEPLKQDVKDSR